MTQFGSYWTDFCEYVFVSVVSVVSVLDWLTLNRHVQRLSKFCAVFSVRLAILIRKHVVCAVQFVTDL